MNDTQQDSNRDAPQPREVPPAASQCIDWYSEGEERIVEAGGIRMVVRFVGRKGRRGRIAIAAPPGAVFRTPDRTQASDHEAVRGGGVVLGCSTCDQ